MVEGFKAVLPGGENAEGGLVLEGLTSLVQFVIPALSMVPDEAGAKECLWNE